MLTFAPRVGSYQDEVRKVLAEQLLTIFKLHPLLVIDFHRDILDFISNLRTLTSGGEHCYMHLVSPTYCMSFLTTCILCRS